jgi:hypothetical protein
MFRRKVKSPDGKKWTLGRHWLPRRKRFKKVNLRDANPDVGFPDIGGDDLGIFGVIIAAIAGLIVAAFLVLLFFNVFALALELILVIVIALAGIIGRVVFRRPWIVFARHDKERLEWPVVGYFNSRRRIEEIAGQLSMGTQLEPAPRNR